MADNAQYLEDRKFILESLQEHKENIKVLFENDTDIKLTLNSLVLKMAAITFTTTTVFGVVVAVIMNKFLGI
jgi:hypothetical protein